MQTMPGRVLLLVVAVSLIGCDPRAHARDAVSRKGRVLDEREESGEVRVVVQEGARIVLYRVWSSFDTSKTYGVPKAPRYFARTGHSSETFSVDTERRTCTRGSAQIAIDCKSVAERSDGALLSPFMPWLCVARPLGTPGLNCRD